MQASIAQPLATRVSEESRCVAALPQMGKPDARIPKPSEGPDTRPRVLQKLIEWSCHYRVMSILREHYKAPNTTEMRERHFEKMASLRQKTVSSLHRDEYQFCRSLTEMMQNPAINRANPVLSRQKMYQSAQQVFNQKNVSPEMRSFLQQEQYDHFCDFIPHLIEAKENELATKTLSVNERFFEANGIPLREYYQRMVSLDPLPFHTIEGKLIEFDHMPLTNRAALSDTLAQRYCAEKYGLQLSPWHPSLPFEALIEEIGQHGPLTLGGKFGRACYTVPPTKSAKLFGGREVYFWKKNDPKEISDPNKHYILIVGCEKSDGKNLVYYIDPQDENDPAHPESQPLYALSYESLTAMDRIGDTICLTRNNAPRVLGYGFFRPDWRASQA